MRLFKALVIFYSIGIALLTGVSAILTPDSVSLSIILLVTVMLPLLFWLIYNLRYLRD